MKANWFWKIFSKFYQLAGQKMCRECQEFIEKKSKILDLGCGSGVVGKTFQEFFQADLTGVDIKDQKIVDLPFFLIDGKNLPFSEKYFDLVLINYVLHHAEDPMSLLKEAKRVSRRLIIYEDLAEGFFSKLFCFLHGFSFDLFWANPNKTIFKTEKEWEKTFKEIGLKLIFKKKIANFPVKKELFVLGV